MLGSMKTTEGDSYWLEDCNGFYVMKQFAQKNFSPERAVKLPGDITSKLRAGASDNTTQVYENI